LALEPGHDRQLEARQYLVQPIVLCAGVGNRGHGGQVIMPQEIAETPVDEQITSPVGSGPYMSDLDAWQPGVQAVYTRFEDYQPRDEERSGLAGEKIAHFDRIERLLFADDLTAANALSVGEIDYIPLLSPDTVPVLQGNPHMTVAVKNPLGKSVQIVLNHMQPPFDDMRVRQTAQLALGQLDYLVGMYGDMTQVYQKFRPCSCAARRSRPTRIPSVSWRRIPRRPARCWRRPATTVRPSPCCTPWTSTTSASAARSPCSRSRMPASLSTR